MIRNKITNEFYTDRKEAKTKMGHASFNKAVKRGELEYLVTGHDTTDVVY